MTNRNSAHNFSLAINRMNQNRKLSTRVARISLITTLKRTEARETILLTMLDPLKSGRSYSLLHFYDQDNLNKDLDLKNFSNLQNNKAITATQTTVTAAATQAIILLDLLLFRLKFNRITLMSPSLSTSATMHNLNLRRTMVSRNTRNLRQGTTLAMRLKATRFHATRTTKRLSTSALNANTRNILLNLTRNAARNSTINRLLDSTLDSRLNIRHNILSFRSIRLSLLTNRLLRLNTRTLNLNTAAASRSTQANNIGISTSTITNTLSSSTKRTDTLRILTRLLTSLVVLGRRITMTFTNLIKIKRPLKTIILDSTRAMTGQVSLLARL